MGKKKTHTHTQNDAPFVAFHDMRAFTFVLADKMADVSIAGMQWFILIPRLDHTGSYRPSDSSSKPGPIYIEKKYKIWNRNQQPAAILGIQRKAVVRLFCTL